MSRWGTRWTVSDVARYTGQQGALVPQAKPRTRRVQRYGTVLSGVRQTEMGWVLTYNDWMPWINGHQVNKYDTSKLAKHGRKVFGELPAAMHPQVRATVEVIYVLGPRQKGFDRDSLAALCVGLLDSIQPSYLKNDNERWADVSYRNERTRRGEGPFIEIQIAYAV